MARFSVLKRITALIMVSAGARGLRPAGAFGVLMGSELRRLLLARFDVNDTELRFRENRNGVSFVLGLVNLLRNRDRENQQGEYQWFQDHGRSQSVNGQKAGQASEHRLPQLSGFPRAG